MLVLLSCMSVAILIAQSRWLSCHILGIRGSMKVQLAPSVCLVPHTIAN